MANHVRLSKGEIESIIEMTKGGKSLREISSLTGKGITTIYYYSKKIKPRQTKPFLVNLLDEQIGELIGAFAGDGSYHLSNTGRGVNYRITFALSSEKELEYRDYVLTLLKHLNLNPFIVNSKIKKCTIIAMNSKDFAIFILSYLNWEPRRSHTVRLRRKLGYYSEDFLRGFAR